MTDILNEANKTDLGKSLQAMVIIEKIRKELTFQNDAASIGIKNAIVKNYPAMDIVKTVKEMLQDGWKGLSIELSKNILDF